MGNEDASGGPWIATVEPAEASGALARLYESARDPRSNEVDAIIRVHSLRPASLAGHLRIYSTIMHAPDGLDRARREMIAVAVSAANGCGY